MKVIEVSLFGDDPTPAEEERRQKTCLDKLTWASREAAVAARAYAVWQYGAGQSRPQPYRCQYCNKWHLAHG